MEGVVVTSDSIRRQDASAHMPLAICHNGRVIDLIPEGVDASDQRTRDGLFAAAFAETGFEVLEILAVCHLHPTSSAVDCLDCEPVA
jgi:hypothetical protein